MPKKKKTSKSKGKHTSKAPSVKMNKPTRDAEKVLIQNFISLQKVMTNMALKFDNLSTQISKLLELFEISAKNLAEKDFTMERDSKMNKEVAQKMDSLINQNKIIAKGLALLHESNIQDFSQKPHPKDNRPKPLKQSASPEMSEYQKSISSDRKNEPQRF